MRLKSLEKPVDWPFSSIAPTTLRLITQAVAYVEQRVDRVLGIVPNAQSPSLASTVPQPGSGSGSGSGAAVTHNAPNQSLTNVTPKSGGGSGNGATMTAHAKTTTQGISKPMLSAGSGSGGCGSGGSGSGSVGSGTGSGSATVSGQVWLDNNGDGSKDDVEKGYQGITVELTAASTGNVIQSMKTDPNGNYSFTITEGPAPGGSYFYCNRFSLEGILLG